MPARHSKKIVLRWRVRVNGKWEPMREACAAHASQMISEIFTKESEQQFKAQDETDFDTKYPRCGPDL